MRIGDDVPLPEPNTISDTSSDGENSAQSIPTRGSEEAITESFSGEAAQVPQLLDNLAPDRLEPHRPDNIFEEQVKIDVFSNAPGNLDLTQGLNPSNLTEHDVDRHYMGTLTGAGADALRKALGGMGADALNRLLGGSKPSSGASVPDLVAGKDMSLVGSSFGGKTVNAQTTYHDDGSRETSYSTKGGKVTDFYGSDGKLAGTHLESKAGGVTTTKTYDADGKPGYTFKTSAEDGVTTDKLYDENGNYTGKYVTSADGKVTHYDKDGNEVKYTTEEGGTAPVLAEEGTHNAFLGLQSVGGGYTDGRPELQSDAPKERDRSRDPYFGVIDVNPDSTETTPGTEATTGSGPNLGNIAQPETRPELQAPAPEMPSTPGSNPHSDGSN